MKNYIIAYTSFFDNIMQLKKVQSDSPEHALQDYLYQDKAEEFRNTTLEQLEAYAFDCDSVIGIIEI